MAWCFAAILLRALNARFDHGLRCTPESSFSLDERLELCTGARALPSIRGCFWESQVETRALKPWVVLWVAHCVHGYGHHSLWLIVACKLLRVDGWVLKESLLMLFSVSMKIDWNQSEPMLLELDKKLGSEIAYRHNSPFPSISSFPGHRFCKNWGHFTLCSFLTLLHRCHCTASMARAIITGRNLPRPKSALNPTAEKNNDMG